jgi:hypothetical protein
MKCLDKERGEDEEKEKGRMERGETEITTVQKRKKKE